MRPTTLGKVLAVLTLFGGLVLLALAIAMPKSHADPGDAQNEYLRILKDPANGWKITGSDHDLVMLAIQTCNYLHPSGPNYHATEGGEDGAAAILRFRYHFPPDTATAYVGLVESELCP